MSTNTTNNKTIPLTLTQEPEIYHGEPTGKLRWLAVAEDKYHRTASVLGRAYTRAAAVADWNLRASLDRHQVTGIDQNAGEFTTADIDRILGLADQFLEDWSENDIEEPDSNYEERAAEWQRVRPLLVAAPNMLKALKRLVGEHADLGEVDLSDDECEALDLARAAIAEATEGGQTS